MEHGEHRGAQCPVVPWDKPGWAPSSVHLPPGRSVPGVSFVLESAILPQEQPRWRWQTLSLTRPVLGCCGSLPPSVPSSMLFLGSQAFENLLLSSFCHHLPNLSFLCLAKLQPCAGSRMDLSPGRP